MKIEKQLLQGDGVCLAPTRMTRDDPQSYRDERDATCGTSARSRPTSSGSDWRRAPDCNSGTCKRINCLPGELIPGSRRMRLDTIDRATAAIPKTTEIIIYCGGAQCAQSLQATRRPIENSATPTFERPQTVSKGGKLRGIRSKTCASRHQRHDRAGRSGGSCARGPPLTDRGKQFLKRPRELLDPFVFERAVHVAEVDASGGECFHQRAASAACAPPASRHDAVVLEQLQGLRWNRRDRVRSDERLDVHRIRILGIIVYPCWPRATLRLGTLCLQRPPPCAS